MFFEIDSSSFSDFRNAKKDLVGTRADDQILVVPGSLKWVMQNIHTMGAGMITQLIPQQFVDV